LTFGVVQLQSLNLQTGEFYLTCLSRNAIPEEPEDDSTLLSIIQGTSSLLSHALAFMVSSILLADPCVSFAGRSSLADCHIHSVVSCTMRQVEALGHWRSLHSACRQKRRCAPTVAAAIGAEKMDKQRFNAQCFCSAQRCIPPFLCSTAAHLGVVNV
jgi:hypothetical protein